MDFKQPYNQNIFIDFIKGFLPDFDFRLEQIGNTKKFNYIKSIRKLGRSNNLELVVYEVDHRSENDPRVSLSREIFSFMKEYAALRALVIFKNDTTPNYRFSLVTFNFSWEEGKKIKTEYSNPRRYSFYLGPDAKTKTPENFLIKRGEVKDFNDLLDRFNVEIVTKEFYQSYKKLFEKLLKHLRNDKAFNAFAGKHGLKLEIFAKKMLGQIVFIYFLEKKGWLGAKKGEYISKGDKCFLRNLFEKCQQNKGSFFNEYLEYLFYECLNKMPEKAGSFHREKFDCQIPFLNGGLFEPVNDYHWKEEFINIPNDIFSNKDESGILDIFDLYNFTIDENTPDDQEISVDPEMLGKVFENLLEDNIRKGQGAFYTPREIVQYMCRESLINYLVANHANLSEKNIRNYINYSDVLNKNIGELGKVWKGETFTPGQFKELDDLLKNVKIVDPACGSGAFLVGMLQEIIKLRVFLQLTPDSELFLKSANSIKELSIYELKKETIQNCLYGVDIDPGAVDIAKLRFWLSIVVEEDINDIEPLPNLDYKIIQGNSLLEDLVIGDSVIKFNFNGNKKIDGRTKEQKELFRSAGVQGKLILEESDTLAEKIEKYHTEYFSITDPEKKKILKKKIDNIEDELIQSKCQEEIRNAENFIKNNTSDSKKILKNTENILAVKKVLNKWKTDHLRPFFPWKLHFGEVFNRENSGFDVVIANPPYEEVSSLSDKKMFQKIYSDVLSGHYDLYIFFFKKAFDISKNGATISFITPHTYLHYTQYKNLRSFIYKNSRIKEITNRMSGVFDAAVVDNVIIVLQVGDNSGSTKFSQKEIRNQNLINVSSENITNGDFNEDSFDLDSIKNLGIFKKFIIGCEPLGEVTESSQGITVYAKVQGKKINYFRSVKEDEFCQPFVKGRNIQKYTLEWEDAYIKYGDWLWCPRNKKFFENEKLFFRQTADRLIGTYEKKPMFCIDSVHSIIQKDSSYNLKFILAILNSQLGDYLYKLLITETGKVFAQVKLAFLRKIPIKKVSPEQQEPFINLIDKILEITESEDYINNSEKQAKVREYEKQIDKMVYKLYNLTPEEIKTVENSSK